MYDKISTLCKKLIFIGKITVNDMGIWICSAISMHCICLYLSDGLNAEIREKIRTLVKAQMVTLRRYLRSFTLIYIVLFTSAAWTADKFTFKIRSSRISLRVKSFENLEVLCFEVELLTHFWEQYQLYLFNGLRRWEGERAKRFH